MGAIARKREWTFKSRQDPDYSKGDAYQKYREPSDILPARPSPWDTTLATLLLVKRQLLI